MPPNIYEPIRLTESDASKLKRFVAEEIRTVETGRAAMMDEWKAAIADYEAQPPTQRRDFPFEGACNIIMPTIATTVDAIFAREINTVFALSPLWTVKPLNSRWQDAAKPTENFLEWSQAEVMRMYDVCWPWYLETTKLGTGFVKMPWVEDIRRQLTYGAAGALAFDNVVYHLGPKPEYVPIQDMWLPDGDWDEQNSPWIGNTFRLTKGQLAARKRKPYGYENVDAVPAMNQKDVIRQYRDQIEGFERGQMYGLYELMEIWADYDVDGDGYEESVVITWDKSSENLLRVIYNPYVEGYRPYHRAAFMKREGRWQGIGVARMLRQIAEGITTQFRQFIDNATVANTRIWKTRRGSGLRRGEKLYPGKVLFLSDPANDLVGEQMGDIYNSQLSVLASLREASERRTGLSDVHLGIESPRVVNRMPATNMLSLLQEGNRRFDLTIRDMRYATALVGEHALALYRQFRPAGVAYNVLDKDGRIIEDSWSVPAGRFKGNLSVLITSTSQGNNRELEKQSLTQLIQMMSMYYDKVTQAVALLYAPNTPGEMKQVVHDMLEGGDELMRRLLQAYAMQDADKFLPNVSKILGQEVMPNVAAGPTGPGGPAAGGLAGLLSIPGMAGAGRALPGPPAGGANGGQQRGGLQQVQGGAGPSVVGR